MYSLIARSTIVSLLLLLLVPLPRAAAQTAAQRQMAQQLYLQAVVLERQNKPNEAIEKMLEALRLVPKNDAYLAYTAGLELRTGKASSALQHAEEAARIKPRNASYQVLVMRAALEDQNAEQAEQYARKVIGQGAARVGQPNIVEARRVLSEALYLQALALDHEEKRDKAAARMKEALGLDTKNAWYRTYLGELEKLAARDAFDRHALDTPAEEEKTIEGLAGYLVKPAKNDRDKARLIFRWVTNRLTYDVEALFGRRPSEHRPEGVLQKRRCVCEGYARLYAALARAAGLEIELVPGRTKTRLSDADGKPLTTAEGKPLGHVWVAVKLDGEWKLLDPTWGSGSINKGRFLRRYNDYYFLTPPEQLIFTHLPRQERWQLLPSAVAAEEFDRWGYINSMVFNYGVKVTDVQELVKDKDFKGVVEGLSHAGPRVKVLNVPLHKHLQPGKRYPVRIEAPGMVEVGVSINNKTSLLARKGRYFEGFIPAPAGGEVILCARWSFKDKQLHGFLRYSVE